MKAPNNRLLALAAAALASSAHGVLAGAADAMPPFRIEADAFQAGEADIRAVCSSAGAELWRYFPGYSVGALVVVRRNGGPMVAFARNERGETVIRLDTGGLYWCQYAYQFAHEFCHVLCGYDDDYRGNLWFEETLAETASLFVLRAMARDWATAPPYPNWRDFRDALRRYVDDEMARFGAVQEIYKSGMQEFYRRHRQELEKEPCGRELNGAMAVVLLRYFEEQPERWEAVRWLNSAPSPQGETFEQYLRKWRAAVPERHREFVQSVAELFGVTLDPAGR